jgi:diaminopimelate epimerase
MKKFIEFTKMHGLGNDFMVINTLKQPITNIDSAFIKRLSHRLLGIGFDQLLLLGRSNQADFSCRIYNADGSEAEQCGNGMRCIARFVHEENLCGHNTPSIETKAGVVSAMISDYDHIQIAMGIPWVNTERISFRTNEMTVVSIGNPHAILVVPSILDCKMNEEGHAIATHSAFPNGANVGFMEIASRQHIRLRTYERGVGETVACGSNSCAAVVAGITNGLLDREVRVELPFGDLSISWNNPESQVMMTGPASRVFNGKVQI